MNYLKIMVLLLISKILLVVHKFNKKGVTLLLENLIYNYKKAIVASRRNGWYDCRTKYW